MKFNHWLEKEYMAWIARSGHRRTQKQFAEYLGIRSSLLSHYLNGSREPSSESLEKIALRLGDQVYDVLERPRPDPLLREVIRRWGSLSEEQKRAIEALLQAPGGEV